MRSRRPQTALFLLMCGVTLLIAIFVGEKMGDRVLHQTTQTAIVPTLATPTAAPSSSEAGPVRDWRKTQIVTVATDPGFPDPRVTPPPTPTPKPKPTKKPSPTPTPFVPTQSPLPTATEGASPTPSASPTPDTTRPPR